MLSHHTAAQGVDGSLARIQRLDLFPSGDIGSHFVHELEFRQATGNLIGHAVVDSGDLASKSADINRGGGDDAFPLHLPEHRHDLLRLSKSKDRDGDTGSLFQCRSDCLGEAFFFPGPGESLRKRRIPASCLHEQDIDRFLRECGSRLDGLILKVHIPGIEELLSLRADHHARGSKDMSGIMKRDGGSGSLGAAIPIEVDRPLQGAVLPATSRHLNGPVGKKGVIRQFQFLLLSEHHIHRVVEHHIRDPGRAGCHENRHAGLA